MSVFTLHAMIPWVASLAALGVSGVTDVKRRIIPNECAVLIAFCGLGLSLKHGTDQVFIGLAAAFAVVLALGVLAHYGLTGGGDVKLIGAVTLLVPPGEVGLLLVEIALAGGVVSCAYLLAGRALRRMPSVRQTPAGPGNPVTEGHWLSREAARIAAGDPMPYALAVLGGVSYHFIRELHRCLSAISCSL